MSNSTTRISDLQDFDSVPSGKYKPQTTQHIANEFYGNISGQPQYPSNENDSTGQNYQPLNIHPNPYGHNVGSPENIPLPEPSPQRGQQHKNGYIDKEQTPNQLNYTLENMPPQRLPSRDIPMNPVEYQQDETIQANYIPKVKLTSDYIREYEAANEQSHKEYREHKYRQEAAHGLISDLQLPILVAVLYFIFQMPIVNTMLRKYFTFMSIYHDDGNFNLMGLLIKSIAFGSIFYTFNLISNKISNL